MNQCAMISPEPRFSSAWAVHSCSCRVLAGALCFALLCFTARHPHISVFDTTKSRTNAALWRTAGESRPPLLSAISHPLQVCQHERLGKRLANFWQAFQTSSDQTRLSGCLAPCHTFSLSHEVHTFARHCPHAQYGTIRHAPAMLRARAAWILPPTRAVDIEREPYVGAVESSICFPGGVYRPRLRCVSSKYLMF